MLQYKGRVPLAEPLSFDRSIIFDAAKPIMEGNEVLICGGGHENRAFNWKNLNYSSVAADDNGVDGIDGLRADGGSGFGEA